MWCRRNNREELIFFSFFLCTEMKSAFGVAIRLLNATQLQILIRGKKRREEKKNIIAEFFRNANQVLKLLDCRAINIPTGDLVSITSSHKTRVPLCSGGCGKHLLSFSL